MHHSPQALLHVWDEWYGLKASLPPEALPEAMVQQSTASSSHNGTEDEELQLALALERSLHDR
jgi:hypothetical protein